MHLKDFLRPAVGRPLSNTAFADMIGRHESIVSRWVRGTVMPDAESLRLIEQATDGAVTANDMLAGLQPKRRAA